MDNTLSDKAIADVQKLVVASQGAKTVEGGNIPYVLVPQGYTAQSLPDLIFNNHTPTPERIKRAVKVFDSASFIEYYNLFDDAGSRVFADENNNSVVALLDYHQMNNPRWVDHKLTLTLRLSEEWTRWTKLNGQQVTQQAFVEFLEQNCTDISAPDPASIRDIANDLSATTEMDFQSAKRQSDGSVRFKCIETTKTKVGGNEVEVPDRFRISIPVFVGGDRIDIDAFLRFRIAGQKLSFFYTLVRPEAAVRAAFKATRDQIETGIEGLTIINGDPS